MYEYIRICICICMCTSIYIYIYIYIQVKRLAAYERASPVCIGEKGGLRTLFTKLTLR